MSMPSTRCNMRANTVGHSNMHGRHRQSASASLKSLADIGLLQEIKAGREDLCINPALLELLTEKPPLGRETASA